MSAELAPTARTAVRRQPDRARYDRALTYRVLDEAYVCHVGVVADGTPRVIPTSYARAGDLLYLHGSTGSGLLGALRDGAEACVTVTLVDGLVLARSGFHHSVNYRSVVAFGALREVVDPVEKEGAMDALVEHVVPGRSAHLRRPTRKELAATMVLALLIAEASAKVRTGPPADDPEDLEAPVWAGELPLRTAYGAPLPDPLLPPTVAAPSYLTNYRRPG